MPLYDMIYGISQHTLVYGADGEIAAMPFSDVNASFEMNVGLKSESVLGRCLTEALPGLDFDWRAAYKEIVETGRPKLYQIESDYLKKSLSVSFFNAGADGFMLTWYDLSPHISRKEELGRISGLFSVLSRIDKMLLDICNPGELYRKACEITVMHKDFELVWIGENDPSTNRINILASAGAHAEYLSDLVIYSDERPEGMGPGGTAFREGRTCVYNDFLASKSARPWWKAAESSGINSVAAVPVKFYGMSRGVLCVYSTKRDFFKSEEIELLEEIALGISNGLERIDREEKRRQAESGTAYLIYHDMLTGLKNRRFIEEEQQRLDNAGNLPLSILMADVNGLKLINDAFGHKQGDELLKCIAEALRGALGNDARIARTGGDEFMALLPGTGFGEAERLAENIRSLLADAYVSGLNVSVSLGWDTKESPGEDLFKVRKSAEDAMYRNKIFERQGKRSSVLIAILSALHEKNPREEQHSKRVRELCKSIGTEMGLSSGDMARLKTISLAHDIGKIALDDRILNKSGALTGQERLEINRHSEIGYRILSASYHVPELSESVLHHHERWDGKGYPDGLAGESIPLFSRIIAVADAYDAMTADRPYRKAMGEDFAVYELCSNAGTQFDPAVAKLFVERVLGRDFM